uniref:Melanoma cell adhesion molecule a n=1 Tax=Mastacembelus armatus TaxID=205130 RepID=A0A3Q3L4M6_9TELE
MLWTVPQHLQKGWYRFIFFFFSAWAKVELTMHESVEVYLGESAQIPCQYNITGTNSENSFVMIQWFVRAVDNNSRVRIFYGDVNLQIVDKNTDYSDRIMVISDQQGTHLTIQNIQLSDEREFFCQVNGLAAGNAEGKTHLRVFAHPEAPVIEGVLTGISVTHEVPSKVASCEARNGFPKPNITWYKNSMPLEAAPGYVNILILVTRDSGFYSIQSTLEYKVVKEDKDAHFSCEVSFFVPGAIRTVKSNSINVTVHYPATMVELWKESPQGFVKEGDTVELRCQGDGNPPPPFIFNREQSSGDVLILSPVSRKDSGIYQCHPVGTDGYTEVKGEMQLTVHYLDPAVVVPKDSEVMLKGEDLTATCNALSSLKTYPTWYKDGEQVGQGNTLHLHDATYETTGEYICEVSVPSLPALHTSGSVNIIVQGQSSSIPSHSLLFQNVSTHMKLRQGFTHTITVISDCQSGSSVMSRLVRQQHVIMSFSACVRVCVAEGSGVIIVVIILCLLLLAILGSVIYFLHKKGKIPCGRSGKQEITKEKTTKDDIVVEMKTNTKNEEAVLLKAVNGDKKSHNDQVRIGCPYFLM